VLAVPEVQAVELEVHVLVLEVQVLVLEVQVLVLEGSEPALLVILEGR